MQPTCMIEFTAFETKNGSKVIFNDSNRTYVLCEGTIKDVISSAEEDMNDEDPKIWVSAVNVILKLAFYKEMTMEQTAIFIMAMLEQIEEEL